MRTIKRFEGQAAQKGVKICNFCGFDSIPSDLGTLFVTHYLQKKLGRCAGSLQLPGSSCVSQCYGPFKDGARRDREPAPHSALHCAGPAAS